MKIKFWCLVCVLTGLMFSLNVFGISNNTRVFNGKSVKVSTDAYLNRAAQRTLNKLPENIRNEFTSQGWEIVVLECGELNKAYKISFLPGFYCDGVTDLDNKVIYINGRRDEIPVIYHEIGHFIDYTYDGEELDGLDASAALEFCKAYNAERDAFGEYGTQRVNEFFSETVYYYLTDPEYCQDKAPMSYKYVSKVIENF